MSRKGERKRPVLLSRQIVSEGSESGSLSNRQLPKSQNQTAGPAFWSARGSQNGESGSLFHSRRRRGFIDRQRGEKAVAGPIVDTEGKALGMHRGITGYTIGQRKGLGIAVGKPIYVTKIDAASNTVMVGEDQDLYQHTFTVKNPNWISLSDLTEPIRARVKIRYNHRPQWATVSPVNSHTLEISFERAQRAIAPGQLAVFYDRDRVIGSAWIDSIIT